MSGFFLFIYFYECHQLTDNLLELQESQEEEEDLQDQRARNRKPGRFRQSGRSCPEVGGGFILVVVGKLREVAEKRG